MTDDDHFSQYPRDPSCTAGLSEKWGGISTSVRDWEMISIDFGGLTQENFNKMPREKAQILWERLNCVQSMIRVRMEILRRRIWPEWEPQ